MNDSELIEEDFGNYIITKKVGQGAFGDVYKATDIDTQQEVAVKVNIKYFVIYIGLLVRLNY
jgi:serine/threonine protein kinase